MATVAPETIICRPNSIAARRQTEGDRNAFTGGEAGPTPEQIGFPLSPDDRVFADSPEAGSPACLCSRCGCRIQREPVLRMWPTDGGDSFELRYCSSCYTGRRP